jgi:hypothetical protein
MSTLTERLAEIYAAQAAYRARPYEARWEGSHIGSTQRFHTKVEAIDWIFQAARVTREDIARAKRDGDRSWINLDLRDSYVDLGEGRIPAMYVLFETTIESRW